MHSRPPSQHDFQARLLKLEKQNRRFKQLAVVLLILPTLLLLTGQASSKKTVEANEFVLRDDGGNIRARLFVAPKRTNNLTLPGVAPVPVTYNPEAMLAFYDEKQEVATILTSDHLHFINSHTTLGDGSLVIGNGFPTVMVSPYNVTLVDENGFQAILGTSNLVTPQNGETQKRSAASLVLFDKNKNVIWKAP